MTVIDSTITLEEILTNIQANLIPIGQIEDAISTPDLLRALSAMQGILVLTSLIDVKLLPESERGVVADLREIAAHGHAAAWDLLSRHTTLARETFLGQYENALDSTEYVLNLINQRLAFRFGRMIECTMKN
jgi:hypothetical protein